MRFTCDMSLIPESKLRQYHYMMFKGRYTNHTYRKTWIKLHNLNETFYTDEGNIIF